jgi:8-amino-7-oxononanoate synthase
MSLSPEAELVELEQQTLLRRLRTVVPEAGAEVSIEGQSLVGFASNDYLGLARHPALKSAAANAAERFGSGAGASRLVCGTLPPHVALESALARFKQTEASLVFSSGYAAALGTISALVGRGDVVILDKLCHASLIDGARLSGAQIRVFPHNHLAKLQSHLDWARRKVPGGRILVVTESVFSMDGDQASLREIVELKERFGALLLLDEAHAIGVLGRQGRGLADQWGLADRVDLQLGTLSKAIGAAGGYVCTRKILADLLINRARSFVYSTALPPPVAAAALAALTILESEEGAGLQTKLWRNLGKLQSLEAGAVTSAIFPVILGNSGTALRAADALQQNGFLVPAIRYPTVPRESARLRITVSATHTENQVAALCDCVRSFLPR